MTQLIGLALVLTLAVTPAVAATLTTPSRSTTIALTSDERQQIAASAQTPPPGTTPPGHGGTPPGLAQPAEPGPDEDDPTGFFSLVGLSCPPVDVCQLY